MLVFTQRMSTFDFHLHQRCQLQRAKFYFAFIFKKYTRNWRMKFSMAKTEKRTWHWNGQMGDFKLYNAIWREKNWEETASCNRIISIVHQSCHLKTQTRYYVLKHMVSKKSLEWEKNTNTALSGNLWLWQPCSNNNLLCFWNKSLDQCFLNKVDM